MSENKEQPWRNATHDACVDRIDTLELRNSQLVNMLTVAHAALHDIAHGDPNGELAIRTAKKALGLRIHA